MSTLAERIATHIVIAYEPQLNLSAVSTIARIIDAEQIGLVESLAEMVAMATSGQGDYASTIESARASLREAHA